MRTPRQWFRDHQAWVERELHPDHEAQIRDLLEEREELLTEIRRLQMGSHPVGRALRDVDNLDRLALREALGNHRALRAGDGTAWGALLESLTERDAEHEGGAGA